MKVDEIIFGNVDDDHIPGPQSDDELYGGKDNDIWMYGYENDFLIGKDGKDSFLMGYRDGALRVQEGAKLFDCGMQFDVLVNFRSRNGDTRINEYDVVNVINL